MQNNNFSFRLIAAFLSLIITITSLPLPIIASEIPPSLHTNNSAQEDLKSENSSVQGINNNYESIFEEDKKFRDDFTKHYVDTNGNRYAVIFLEQVNNVVSQYNNRKSIFYSDTTYEVVIDVRGQNWTQEMLDDIVNRISQKTNSAIIVTFMK